MACSSRVLALALLALAVAAGCAAEQGLPPPAPAEVVPPSGFSTGEMPVAIVGDAFYVTASQDLEGESGDTLSSTFRAWLGEVELLEVTRVDARTLAAVVPAGMVPGSYDLVVEGPRGRSAPLAAAYAAVPGPAPVIVVALRAEPPAVVAGETAHVAVRVVNLGPGALAQVKLMLKEVVNGHATNPVAGGPPLVGLAVGAGFDWTYHVPTSVAGTLEFEAKVAAIDEVTGIGVPGPRARVSVTVLERTGTARPAG